MSPEEINELAISKLEQGLHIGLNEDSQRFLEELVITCKENAKQNPERYLDINAIKSKLLGKEDHKKIRNETVVVLNLNAVIDNAQHEINKITNPIKNANEEAIKGLKNEAKIRQGDVQDSLKVIIIACEQQIENNPHQFLDIAKIYEGAEYKDPIISIAVKNEQYFIGKEQKKISPTPAEQPVTNAVDLKTQMLNDRALSVLMKGYNRVKENEFREPLKEVYDRCKKQVENAPSVLLDIRKSAREIDFKPPEGSMARSILDKAQNAFESVDLKQKVETHCKLKSMLPLSPLGGTQIW